MDCLDLLSNILSMCGGIRKVGMSEISTFVIHYKCLNISFYEHYHTF